MPKGRQREARRRNVNRSLRTRGHELKTILTDNGCEFLDITKITIIQSNLYYTHAYASYEKGSVEHANGLLRFHFPKGTDFSKVRPERITAAEAAINNTYRRTSLNGTTALLHRQFTICFTTGGFLVEECDRIASNG